MKKVIFFTVMMSLVAISTFAGGVGVGNGKRIFRASQGFTVEYQNELSLAVENASSFRISNENLVPAGEKVSSIHFTVTRDQAHDQSEVVALAAKEHPGLTFGPMEEPGAKGVYFERHNGRELSGFYYLLTTNLDLVEVEIDAYPEGNGLEWVAPIVHSFVYDVTSPVIRELRVPSRVWPAGSRQKIYFRADDDFSGVDVSDVSLGIDRADVGQTPSMKYWLVQHARATELGNGWYSAEFVVGRYATPGAYVLDWIGIRDRAKNIGGISTHDGHDTFYMQYATPELKLPAVHFTVTSDLPGDSTPPQALEVRTDVGVWEAGSTHRVFIHLADDLAGVDLATVGCWGIESSFGIDGRTFNSPHCTSPREEGNGWYSLAVELGEYLPSGDYYFNNFDFQDHAGNRGSITGGSMFVDKRFYYADSGLTKIPLLHVQVHNGGTAGTRGPVVTELRAEKTVLRAGEPLRIQFRASDSVSGIKVGKGGFFGIMYSLGDSYFAGWIDGPVIADGNDWYHVDLATNPFMKAGDVMLSYFYVHDNGGGSTLLSCGISQPMPCKNPGGPVLPALVVHIVR